jgi:hypothetical protein
MKDISRSGLEEIEKQVKEWQPSGASAQLEHQLLLKEVRIGRRSQELPSWTGVVSYSIHEPPAEDEDDSHIVRNWRLPPQKHTAAQDYAALAGRAERKCMELLGFQMTLPGDTSPIRVGKGIEPNGLIKDSRVFAMWGVRNYMSDVWGSTKIAVKEAKKLLSSPEGISKVSQAILKLKGVEDYRKKH